MDTALLLALPLATADRAVVIEVQGELISKPYIEITLNLLARFGIQVERQGWERFVIPQGSRYQSPGEIHVEEGIRAQALGCIERMLDFTARHPGSISKTGFVRHIGPA